MKKCRICHSRIKKIISLGRIALVGNFFKKNIKQKKYKISLNYCLNCKHVQISEHLYPDLLFKNYLWETGISKSNFFLIKKLLINLKKYSINHKSKVLEIASNDGTFLNELKKKYNSFVLGVDPAKNLAVVAKSKKIPIINRYFNKKLSNILKKKFSKFDFIFARNVIAHTIDPNSIFKGVENLLKDDGIFILEVPHLLNILNQNQYDNIFHEHIGFHSLKSIIDLSKKNGLNVFDVKRIDSQGGSIRCYLQKKNCRRKVSKNVKKILDIEIKFLLFQPKYLEKFKYKIKNHQKKMYKLILKIKKNKRNISIYGASGKGQALMQYTKLNNKLIDYVFDKSKLKQNCFTPGTNIKILNPKFILEKKIDYLIILSWNLKNEILSQEREFIKKGGKIILPFPEPKVLN